MFALVGEFVQLLRFLDKNLYFGMLDFVVVFLHDIPVYMVQKYLVDSSHHHLMINSLVYSKVVNVYFGFVVFCFYSVEKMDNFHFGLVKFVDSHESLLKLLLLVINFVFVKVKGFEYLSEKT